MMCVVLFVTTIAIFLAMGCWQAVILGKDRPWTPGLGYLGAGALGQVIAGRLIWKMIARSARRS